MRLLLFRRVTMTRLPALPLLTTDPYFSVWAPGDFLTDADTTHWCGHKRPVRLFCTVDGKTYRLLGMDEHPAMTTKDLTVTPCTTKAVYACDEAEITLSFTMPFLPEDFDRISTPITLIEACVCSVDGKQHDVDFEFAMTDHLCYRTDDKPELAALPMNYTDLKMTALGRIEQKILCHSGDHVTIDWGYLYLGCREGEIVYDGDMLRLKIGGKADENGLTLRWLAGYDDIASILYFGLPCKSWYARNGKTFTAAMRETMNAFDELLEKCAALDERIYRDSMAAGGEDYAYITAAAWRHVFAAHKLIADRNGKPVLISKENDSNGCAGTVDVSYPSTPLFLKYCPELVNALCRPIVEFAHMDCWQHYDFAPHDVGRYPIINGQVYGNNGAYDVGGKCAHQPPFYLMSAESEMYTFRWQMPVEESGNMLIMMYCAAHYGAGTDVIREGMDLAEKWVNYLIRFGEDPGEQLCTDDFAGHLNHNINLSAKAIVGVACYGRILDLLGKDGSAYQAKAKEMAKSWYERAYDPEGTYLTFDKQGWSMKYNLAWDKALGLGLLDDAFYSFESRSYLKRIAKYGLPLDNRSTYTKSDWELWTASFSDEEVKKAIISAVAVYLKETESRVAFSDWYFTDTGKYRSFIGRSVQGGVFMPMLCMHS